MPLARARTDLPVLLLHNIDQAWDPADIDITLQEVANRESAMGEQGHPVPNVPVFDHDLSSCLSAYDPDRHIVFNWCEEIPGVANSEALAAETLEDLDFTYTGATPEVLRFCWDKEMVKRLLERAGVPTPRWRIYDSLKIDDWSCFPAIVKPSREHCSHGVTTDAVVTSPQKLKDRIGYILDAFRQPALVEDFIDGREFHVSLWGNGSVRMLPPAEMDFALFDNVRDRLCTYDSKFMPGSSHYVNIGLQLPAPLGEAEYERLKKTSILAYKTSGCRDYARLDIRLRDGIFYVLDVNPNSDISAEASMACAAEYAGYSHGEMISRIINLAAKRHPIFGKRPARAASLSQSYQYA
ncbi:MAG: D-alanine--D-alanine ligase family protein [Syntrophales bacterium]